MSNTTGDQYEGESELLDEWSTQTDIWGLEHQDAVEDSTVVPRTHSGRAYASVTVRMNEYDGTISTDPAADDPVSNTIQDLGLEISGIRSTSQTTSKMEIILYDPTDGYDQ